VLSTIVFVVVAIVPLIIYLINAGMSARGERGIAAGIPKPKEAKVPRARKQRTARVRDRKVQYCGRTFTHLSLAILGSQDSCKYCTYEPVESPPEPIKFPGTDTEAAIREAEDIIDQSRK